MEEKVPLYVCFESFEADMTPIKQVQHLSDVLRLFPRVTRPAGKCNTSQRSTFFSTSDAYTCIYT